MVRTDPDSRVSREAQRNAGSLTGRDARVEDSGKKDPKSSRRDSGRVEQGLPTKTR